MMHWAKAPHLEGTGSRPFVPELCYLNRVRLYRLYNDTPNTKICRVMGTKTETSTSTSTKY